MVHDGYVEMLQIQVKGVCLFLRSLSFYADALVS